MTNGTSGASGGGVQRYVWTAHGMAIAKAETQAGGFLRYDDHARIVAGLDGRYAELRTMSGELVEQHFAQRQRAESAEARVRELEQDAARWRFFRERGESLRAPYCYFDIGCDAENLDAAIDAALAARQASAKGGASDD